MSLLCACLSRAVRTSGDAILPILPSILKCPAPPRPANCSDIAHAFVRHPSSLHVGLFMQALVLMSSYLQAVVVSTARQDFEPLVTACLGHMLNAIFTLLQVFPIPSVSLKPDAAV